MALYDRRDFNGTEQRAFAGNFLYSTGANEVAGRHTLGHFDLPLRHCTIALDGKTSSKRQAAGRVGVEAGHDEQAIPAYLDRGEASSRYSCHGVGGGQHAWEAAARPTSAASAIRAHRLGPAGLRRQRARRALRPGAGLARALARLIDRSAASRWCWSATAWAAWSRRRPSARFPQLVKALVLSASPAPPSAGGDGDLARGSSSPRASARSTQGRSMADLAPSLMRGMVAPDADAAAIRARGADHGARPASHLPQGGARCSRPSTAVRCWPAIAVPTLLVAGRRGPQSRRPR